jgi:hypothetical protein
MSTRSLFPVLFVSVLGCGGAAPSKPGATAMSAEPTVSISGEPMPTSDDAAPTADPTKTYPIHLHRNGHVGERARVVLDMAEDATISAHATSRNKVVHKHFVKHLHLEGVWTTTALDDHQDELRATLDVTKLTEDDAVLLKGKRIDLTKGIKKEDATLNVDGKPVSAKVLKALEMLFSVRIDAASSDDIVLGTAHPQSVGGHWPINGERAREDMMNNTEVSSTEVSGEATLVGVEHVGGVDALRIKVDLQIDGMVYPLHHPGATCEPAQGTASLTVFYPVDENRGALEVHTAFAVMARVHVPGPHGVSVTGDVDDAVQHDEYVTPL